MEMTNDSRKLRLASALEKEKANLPTTDIFGNDNNHSDYIPAINYLRYGTRIPNDNDNDLLMACVDDFEMMCNDYDV